jgi:hypothetical protein
VETDSRPPLLTRLDQVLLDAGYVPTPEPLTIGGIPFEGLRSYLAGPGFLDLVVVLEGGSGLATERRDNFWIGERLARALDSSGSPRPLTLIVVGLDGPVASAPEYLLRLGRVLVVDDPDTVQLQLAPILPLVMEPGANLDTDPLRELEAIGGDVNRSARARLLRAARTGPQAVTRELTTWFDDAFAGNEE